MSKRSFRHPDVVADNPFSLKTDWRIEDSPYGGREPNSVYKSTTMDRDSHWITTPADAYRLWQETDAVGADRRPFSARSRIQHAAMFERFLRYLTTKGMTLAAFGAADVESFFADVDTRCSPGTTTRLRYGKMLDRLCRHLVEEGIREENPVTAMAAFERWPEDGAGSTVP
ncbi:hypothetical protein [Paraburkholderia humisilvae]